MYKGGFPVKEPGYLNYLERDFNLGKLGHKNYKSYLASELWKQIRESVFIRDSFKCKKCQRLAQIVHHTSYDIGTLRGESLEKLVSMCNRCHHQEERKMSFLGKTKVNPRDVFIDMSLRYKYHIKKRLSYGEIYVAVFEGLSVTIVSFLFEITDGKQTIFGSYLRDNPTKELFHVLDYHVYGQPI